MLKSYNSHPISKEKWFKHLAEEGGIFVGGLLDENFSILYKQASGMTQIQQCSIKILKKTCMVLASIKLIYYFNAKW